MDENEQEVIYDIPANYTESGKLLGGLVALRNAVETIVTVALAGIAEHFLPLPFTARLVLMVLSLIPVGIACLVGVEGESLWRFSGHVIRFLIRRRKLHLRKPDLNDETKP